MSNDFSDGAIDALIAASLRRAYSSESPSEAEIEEAIKAGSVEEPEDTARLERIRSQLCAGSPSQQPKKRQILGQLMAMNRKNQDDEFSEPTQNAIDEARRKAIEELIKEEESKEGGETDDHS